MDAATTATLRARLKTMRLELIALADLPDGTAAVLIHDPNAKNYLTALAVPTGRFIEHPRYSENLAAAWSSYFARIADFILTTEINRYL